MKVYIDIPVFTKGSAIGKVAGTVEMSALPEEGDVFDFVLCEESAPAEALPAALVNATLEVAARSFSVGRREYSLSLSDLVAASREEAKDAMIYLERRYDRLFADFWDEEDWRSSSTDSFR